MEETKHRQWDFKQLDELIHEHNALHYAWKDATAEAERLREQNKLQKKQLLDIDSRISPLMAENANLRAELAERREADWVLAADAERLMQDAQPTPVDLPDAETLAERLHEAYEAAVRPKEGQTKWNKLENDDLQRKGRMAQARAALELFRPWLVERAPVAEAETLEDLARIARDTRYAGHNMDEWEQSSRAARDCWRRTVAAVLRAARPMIDMPRHEIAEAANSRMSTDAVMEQIEKRIRYRVEVPDDECDIATDAYMLGKHDGKTAPVEAPIHPHFDASKTKAEQGIYDKFHVSRTDGRDQPGCKHSGCAYFVIDRTHDKFAAPALRAYAIACASEYPALSSELLAAYPAPVTDGPSDEELAQVQPAECPTCAEKDQEIEALMADIRAHADAESDLVTALGRADAETKEAWEKYKRRDAQYIEACREMQAAQTRVLELEFQVSLAEAQSIELNEGDLRPRAQGAGGRGMNTFHDRCDQIREANTEHYSREAAWEDLAMNEHNAHMAAVSALDAVLEIVETHAPNHYNRALRIAGVRQEDKT